MPKYKNSIKYPKRLLKLADLLMADARSNKGIKFDFSDWGHVKHKFAGLLPGNRAPVSCATTACAMGLAAVSGAFKRQGLDHEVVGGFLRFTIKGEHVYGHYAARQLFGIPPNDAAWLFTAGHPGRGKGPAAERAVAKRLRDYVAGRVRAPNIGW